MALIIDKKIVDIQQPNISDVNILMQNHSGKFFGLIEEQLKLIVSNWDDFRETISIQDAIYIMAFYRATVWNDIPIYTDTNTKQEILPSEMIKKTYNELQESFLISGEVFKNKIPLKSAIEAERKAIEEGNLNLFGDYILGAGCKKGTSIGIDTILSLKSNPIGRGVYHAYAQSVSDYSPICITLNTDNKRPIGIIADNKEFPFQPSLLFSI